ncbi:MAG: gamma-glutamyl-gamma-aminobutyrate hydrolase family protein [Gemmatimonadaceae bacterium]
MLPPAHPAAHLQSLETVEASHARLVHAPTLGTELLLAGYAVEDHKPLFGLCRGAQVLNVACGGTLVRNVAAELPGAMKHDFPNDGFERTHRADEVALAPGSRLRDVLDGEYSPVNSMHHQSIKTVVNGLRANVTAPDSVFEAIELAGRGFELDLQWQSRSV